MLFGWLSLATQQEHMLTSAGPGNRMKQQPGPFGRSAYRP